MACLRRIIPDIDFAQSAIPYEQLINLKVDMDDFVLAMRQIEPSAIREVFVDVPDVTWQQVGGLEEVKQNLTEAVEWPLRYPELFARAGIHPPKGLLIYGPPGCGKTLLAKAVANESQANFISVKGPALLSKYVGESEQGIREVFHKARQAAPCIIFFDEIDALFPVRGVAGQDSGVTQRVLSQFLAELDGIEELKGVFILGATNRKDILDPAILRPGRFDDLVEVPLPDEATRRAIFEVHMRNKPVQNHVSLSELAASSQGLSSAEIASVCNQAALMALRRAMPEGPAQDTDLEIGITKEDITTALSNMQLRI